MKFQVPSSVRLAGCTDRCTHSFTEARSANQSYSLVGHSLVTALREELTEYYRLLAGLETRLREGGVSLLQLGVWTRQPLARLKLLTEIVTKVGEARARGRAAQGGARQV